VNRSATRFELPVSQHVEIAQSQIPLRYPGQWSQTGSKLVADLLARALICGHITISVLWSNMAYCVKLSGEDLSHYSNEIESVDLKESMHDDTH